MANQLQLFQGMRMNEDKCEVKMLICDKVTSIGDTQASVQSLFTEISTNAKGQRCARYATDQLFQTGVVEVEQAVQAGIVESVDDKALVGKIAIATAVQLLTNIRTIVEDESVKESKGKIVLVMSGRFPNSYYAGVKAGSAVLYFSERGEDYSLALELAELIEDLRVLGINVYPTGLGGKMTGQQVAEYRTLAELIFDRMSLKEVIRMDALGNEIANPYANNKVTTRSTADIEATNARLLAIAERKRLRQEKAMTNK